MMYTGVAGIACIPMLVVGCENNLMWGTASRVKQLADGTALIPQ